jgi:hypothetical protein
MLNGINDRAERPHGKAVLETAFRTSCCARKSGGLVITKTALFMSM